MKKRSGNVDFARFIAAIIIMSSHIFNIGIQEHAFRGGWIYVEFFLMITGYYTARHYTNIKTSNKSKNAVEYTINKFISLLPYTVIVTICGWLTQGIVGMVYLQWSWKDFIINLLGDFSFDLLLISDSYTHPLIGPLWYVSAMIIVFPLFCLLVQIDNRYTKIIICYLFPLMYFGCFGVTGKREFPHDMLRVMAGMMLGVLLYDLSIIFQAEIKKVPKHVLTAIELLTFIYPIYCCYNNYDSNGVTTTRLYLLCHFICLFICLPGYSYTTLIGSKGFNYLGKLSIPVFITHWYIGSLVNMYGGLYNWNVTYRMLLYYVGTLFISALLETMVNRVPAWNRFLQKKIELID